MGYFSEPGDVGVILCLGILLQAEAGAKTQ